MSSKGKDEVPQPTANKKVLNDSQQKSSNQRGKHVLEAQKSSQASSNTKGLQPEIANRIRVSFFLILLFKYSPSVAPKLLL